MVLAARSSEEMLCYWDSFNEHPVSVLLGRDRLFSVQKRVNLDPTTKKLGVSEFVYGYFCNCMGDWAFLWFSALRTPDVS